MAPFTLGILIVTAVVSLIIGAVIIYFSTISYRHGAVDKRKKQREERMKKYISQPGSGKKIIKNAVYDEIKGFVKSENGRKEVSNTISSLFERELENQIDLNDQELTKKYEKIIEGKDHDEKRAVKKYKKTLFAKKETENVIRSIAEGLVVVGSDGEIVMMNPAAEKLLGGKKEDKVGESILENLSDDQLLSFSKESAQGGNKEIEVLGNKEDTKKILRASNAVIEDKNGQTVGMVSVLSDITKQRELEKLKANFVTNVTHELRTPLIAMDKSIKLLLSKEVGSISETQEQFLSIASRNLKRLTNLINDLLDISKLESGKMTINLKPYSIEKITEEAIENFKDWAKTKSIKIKKDIKEKIPKLNIDPDRIMQVLNNLVGNAIKFTPEGGAVTVGARLEGEEVRVNVEDTGIGISKEECEKVFSKFYQSGERTPTDINGTGLGLSIVQEIINLHKGKIWVESEKRKGANFIFKLPVK